MDRQLELEQEAKYMRLVGGKVVYITESEALAEEVLTVTGDRLGEWNQLVREANRVRERISAVYQMVRDGERRPSQHQADYSMLWYQYQEVIGCLCEIDPESVDRFRDKVVARIKELGIRYNVVHDAGNPDFDDFDELLALYEVTVDQAAALSRAEKMRAVKDWAGKHQLEAMKETGWVI